MSGILVASHPTGSETKFHLVQALCLALALCQHGEAAFVCKRASLAFANCLSVSIL